MLILSDWREQTREATFCSLRQQVILLRRTDEEGSIKTFVRFSGPSDDDLLGALDTHPEHFLVALNFCGGPHGLIGVVR